MLFILTLIIVPKFLSNKNLYVGDDGMHSILVDLFGKKHLYISCSTIKKKIMKLVEEEILKTNRLQCNLNIRSYKYDSVFKDKIVRRNRAIGGGNYTLFIDQPGLMTNYLKCDEQYINKILYENNCQTVLVHPRSSKRDLNAYKELNFRIIRPENSEEYIIDNNISNVIGLHSTLLLFCAKNMINVTFLLPPTNCNYDNDYIQDCKKVFKKFIV